MAFEVKDGVARATDAITGAMERIPTEKAIERMMGGLSKTPIPIADETDFYVHRDNVDLDGVLVDGPTIKEVQIEPLDFTTALRNEGSDFSLTTDIWTVNKAGIYNVAVKLKGSFLDDANAAISTFASYWFGMQIIMKEGLRFPRIKLPTVFGQTPFNGATSFQDKVSISGTSIPKFYLDSDGNETNVLLEIRFALFVSSILLTSNATKVRFSGDPDLTFMSALFVEPFV